MSDTEEGLDNKGNQLRMSCIDYATRVVGKPVYLAEEHDEKKTKHTKHHDDVVKVAKEIYDFVKDSK